MGLALEFPIYVVMSHYHLGPRDLDGVTPYGFSMMFKWALAQKKMEAEEAERSNPDSMKVESTSMNRPMPFSEGW